MEKSNVNARSNVIWNILSSVKLTLFLLIILAATSIFGTLIPQRDGAMEFAQKLSPGLVKLFNSLELFDMYHSVWFRFILGALTLNLVVCSLDRLPRTLKLFRTRTKPDRSKPFENLPPERKLTVKGKVEDVVNSVAGLLNGPCKNMEIKETDKGHFIFCEKGRFSYFGVYLVHLSVLLILIGGMIGSIWGFEAFINIPEGETVGTVFLQKSGIPRELGFDILCKKFTVDFYKNGAPKIFKSDLRFLDKSRVMLEGDLRVNHPITFRGITFYQASYGKAPGSKVRLRISSEGRKDWTLDVEKGRPASLPGNEGRLQILKIEEDMRGSMGSALLISILPNQGEEVRFWVFKDWDNLKKRFPPEMLKSPMLNPSAFAPYTFHLDKLESRYYTGLQINRDPGVALVWAGFLVITIGMFVSFFMSHKKIWIWVADKGGKTDISVAGRANKNSIGMERELDRLSEKIQNLFAS
ncbi:MAG: cytochrome c biogenesis protein ResB [Pseudomonadota bacterium]